MSSFYTYWCSQSASAESPESAIDNQDLKLCGPGRQVWNQTSEAEKKTWIELARGTYGTVHGSFVAKQTVALGEDDYLVSELQDLWAQ